MSRFLTARAVLAAAALVLGLYALGCARQDTTATTAETPAPADQQLTIDLSDPQIAAVVVSYNDVEIEHARVAAEKATNPEVKKFAERMITDHGAVNDKAKALAGKLGVTPEESEASRQLTTDGTSFRASLSAKSGADFDHAYIENEIALHESVLNQIDQVLIPSADNAELRTLLEETRPAVEAHLGHARQMHDKLAAHP